jgi:subtilase family serine protease
LEILEDRISPTADPVVQPFVHVEDHAGVSPSGGPGQPAGFSPAQISQAYGFNQIRFNNGTVAGDDQGQTIAIVDAYNQPNIAGDLQTFDATYDLPSPPSFTVVNQSGGASLPSANTTWGLEESLDVEWAHAMAPKANILLVEANSNGWSDLLAAVDYARNQPNVSVVSMSWGGSEFSGEPFYDSYFTTPAGHQGVTFVASTGDSGSAGAPESPSTSPGVLAVGGTNLYLDANNNWSSETAWSGSGGGISAYESQPGYQKGVVTQTSTRRAVPDVAYDASSATPFAVYDTSSYGGWLQVFGTSAGAPQWAALVAIADQGRALAGEGSLDGATQTLPDIYALPGSAFHDITSGSNGAYSAGPGYDLVTGRGSPVANLVVAGLVGSSSYQQPPGQPPSQAPWLVTPAGATPTPVAGTTTSLHVLGDDARGESSLTYTWSVLSEPGGAALPTFSLNGTNAAQNTIVTFHQAGTYVFQATITDSAGLSTTSNVMVLVGQSLTSFVLTPGSPSLFDGGAQQFTALARDQFGNAMGLPPGLTWNVSGAGTIDGNGVYTAPLSGSGTSFVQVAADGVTGSIAVNFAQPSLPTAFNPADPWAALQQIIDAFMAKLSLLESMWQSLLASWNR